MTTVADMLATAADLQKLIDDTGLASDRATLLLELATGEVQAATGQRLVEVSDDPFEMFSYAGSWLELPQRPVSAITSLTLDGRALTAGTDYKRAAGSATLWRRCGWATCPDEPSIVAGVYSHGYAPTDHRLQFARSAALGIAKLAATNASGVESESIDDYRVQYASAVVSAMEQSPNLRKALERTYGAKAGLVRLG